MCDAVKVIHCDVSRSPGGGLFLTGGCLPAFLLFALSTVVLAAGVYRSLVEPGCSPDYAAGWGIAGDGRLTHAGSNTMWFARTHLWPDEGFGLVIVSNDGRLERQHQAFQWPRDRLRGLR